MIKILTEASPSKIDLEIRSLSPINDGEELLMFLDALDWCIQRKTHFDVVQACLNVFLHIHADILTSFPDLCKRMEELRANFELEWQRLESLFQQAVCLVDFSRNT